MKQPSTLPEFLRGISLYLYTPNTNENKWTNATIDMVTSLYPKFSNVQTDRELHSNIRSGVFQDWILKNHYKIIKKLQKKLEYEHQVRVGTITLYTNKLLSDIMQYCSEKDIPYNECFIGKADDDLLTLFQKRLVIPTDFEIIHNITSLFKLWWKIENNLEYKKYLELKTIYDAQIKVSEYNRKK